MSFHFTLYRIQLHIYIQEPFSYSKKVALFFEILFSKNYWFLMVSEQNKQDIFHIMYLSFNLTKNSYEKMERLCFHSNCLYQCFILCLTYSARAYSHKIKYIHWYTSMMNTIKKVSTTYHTHTEKHQRNIS